MTLKQILDRMKTQQALIITPRIDQWLIDNPQGVVVPDWLMPTAQRLLSDDSNSVRTARFGASSRGTCKREQVWKYLGMPTLRSVDPTLMNLFNDGTYRHIRWQLMGMLAGVFTDVEVAYTLPAYNLKVSLDAENREEGFGFELKGTSAFTKVLEEGISERHMLQIHTCMLASGLEKWVYVAEDKRTQDWKEIVIDRDDDVMAQVKEELNALNDAIDDHKLPRPLPSCLREKGEEFQGCPFSHRCIGQDYWPSEEGVWDEG